MSIATSGESRMVPLPTAAARLRMPWARAYNALLAGKLVGEQRGNRWFVAETSVEQLAQERRAL